MKFFWIKYALWSKRIFMFGPRSVVVHPRFKGRHWYYYYLLLLKLKICTISTDVIPQQLATKLPSLNVATFNNSIMQEWLKRGDQEFLRKFMKNPLLQHRNNHLKSEEHKVLLKLEKDKEERRRRQQHHQAIINSAHKPHQPLPSVPKLKIKFGDSSQPSKTQHQQFKRLFGVITIKYT